MPSYGGQFFERYLREAVYQKLFLNERGIYV